MIYNPKKILQNNLNLIDKRILNMKSTKFYNLTTASVFKMKTLFQEGIHIIERFSLDCRKTKTKVNTLANQRA